MSLAMEQCKSGKTSFERMRCANEAENRIEGRETPLMAYKHAAALQIAAREDKGEITHDQAEAEFQMMMARLKMQVAQQAHANAVSFGDSMQRAGASLSAISPPPPPPPMPAPRMQTTCVQQGIYTNCF